MERRDAASAAALAQLPTWAEEADRLRALAEVVAGTADLATAVRDVNRLVTEPLGLRVASCSLVSTTLRAATGAAAPTADEADAIHQWRAAARHGAPLAPAASPAPDGGDQAGDDEAGDILVPVVHRRRVHGALRLSRTRPTRPTGPAASSALLTAIGLGCGEVAWKAGVRRELARSRRRLAIAVEQERTALDAQAALRRRLAALGDRLAAHVAQAPDRVWRSRLEELLLITGEADRELRQSDHLLRSLPAQGDDLPASLRALGREVAAATGTMVKVFVDGPPRRLTSARIEALFHVAVEALLSATSGRATTVIVLLGYLNGQVQLTIRDDGVGLVHRELFSAAAGRGLRGAQDRLDRVGGTLHVKAMQPRGVVVIATLPTTRAHR